MGWPPEMVEHYVTGKGSGRRTVKDYLRELKEFGFIKVALRHPSGYLTDLAIDAVLLSNEVYWDNSVAEITPHDGLGVLRRAVIRDTVVGNGEYIVTGPNWEGRAWTRPAKEEK